ncbi:TenA family protein [Candidatus Woesearchaeota archaeon]|nr:TenA family protein [Candidatus Woesearchaeota archaeon]
MEQKQQPVRPFRKPVNVSQRLWNQNKDLAVACLHHPFVQGIQHGNLERAAFQRYIAQDAFYLQAFRKAYALALAKCSEEHAPLLYELMGGVLQELKLHHTYSQQWGINLKEVKPLPACQTYTDFLMRVAWQEEVGHIITAMAPCMCLYAWLGQEVAKTKVPSNPYQLWIDTYGSEAMQELKKKMEFLLDSLAQDSPEMRGLYRYAMQCELAFFQAPLG